MSTDAVRHRARREAAGKAAKERREKIILGVGIVLLIGLLALEGPKTLDKLKGSSRPAAAPPAATTPSATKPAPAVPRPVNLDSLRRFASKDPFVPQVGAPTSTAVGPTPIAGPAVRKSHFVAKDPFAQQLGVTGPVPAAVAAQPAAPVTTPAATNKGLVVIVASIALGRGHKAAVKAQAMARARGVPNVHIVLSSDYPTLRRGYFAVYSGPYPTLARALKALESIRGRGYVSAYTRRLAN